MTISYTLLTSSRAGFLLAALAATTMSFFSLEAMKRQGDDLVNDRPTKQVNRLRLGYAGQEIESPFQLEDFPENVLVCILSLTFDLSDDPIDAIKKLRSLCLTNFQGFVKALRLSIDTEDIPLSLAIRNLGNLHNLCESGNLDHVMLICAAVPEMAIDLLKTTDLFIVGNIETGRCVDDAYTPLHFAVEKGHAEIIRILLHVAGTRSCEIMSIMSGSSKLSGPRHFSALGLAVFNNNMEIAQLLLAEIGNNSWNFICAKNQIGESALDYAMRKRNVEILKLFAQEFLKHQTRQHPLLLGAAGALVAGTLTAGTYYFL